MKTVGIIAEYNPFHNGHQYQLQTARERAEADYILVVMSGDYVQRGAPAVFGKDLRTKLALLGGADLVLETPVFGSVAPAADFAACSVSLLNHTGVADMLCFGSESGNLSLLKQQADTAGRETEAVSARIREGVRQGMSWPMARARAYEEETSLPFPREPNDILGIEYLLSLKRTHSRLTPLVIKRKGSAYHETETSSSPYASAAAARRAILENDADALKQILPPAFFTLLADDPRPAVTFDDLSLLLSQRLLTAGRKTLLSVSQMPKDLAEKLYKNRLTFGTATTAAARSKDRQYTYTRVSRCLLNLVLGITAEHTAAFKGRESAPWLRVLGFKRTAAPLLSALKRHTDLPVITKTADAKRLLSPADLQLFEKHLETCELYRLLCETKTGRTLPNEYTRPLVIL